MLSAVPCSDVLCCAAQYSTVQFSSVLCCAVLFSAVRCSAVQCSTVQAGQCINLQDQTVTATAVLACSRCFPWPPLTTDSCHMCRQPPAPEYLHNPRPHQTRHCCWTDRHHQALVQGPLWRQKGAKRGHPKKKRLSFGHCPKGGGGHSGP